MAVERKHRADLTTADPPDHFAVGRASSPSLVLDIDPRDDLLGVFNGLNPNGDWTLFVDDASAGGLNTLVSWGLQIQGTVTPPTLTCPAAVNVSADAGQCYASGVSLGTPTVTGQGVTVTNNAPAQFPISATVVTWTVTDGSAMSSPAHNSSPSPRPARNRATTRWAPWPTPRRPCRC